MASAGGHARIDAELMRRLPDLEIVASFGVGYDHIDAKWAGRHGIVVTHTPGVLDDEVADMAIGLMIMAVRKLPQAERYLRAGEWRNGAYPLTASLGGRTMGILGLGRIGKAIARRAEAFGLEVVYHGRKAQAGVPYRFYPSLVEHGRGLRHPDGDRARRARNAASRRRVRPPRARGRKASSSTSPAARSWTSQR